MRLALTLVRLEQMSRRDFTVTVVVLFVATFVTTYALLSIFG